MSECHHLEPIAKVDENNVVREGVNRHAPDVMVVQTGNARPDLGKLLDQMERSSRFDRKTLTHTLISLLVPRQRLVEFKFR